MCLRNTKKRLLSWLLCSILLASLLFGQLNLGVYASETTDSGSSNTWSMTAETFLYYAFNGFAKQISAPYVIFDTFSDFGYDGFKLWCENGDHWSVIENGEVVGHGGGGYSRPSDKIDNAEDIEVPTDVKNLVLNYIQYNVTQNPLSYKQCYIYSYNFLNTSNFSNSAAYYNAKEIIKNCNGWAFTCAPNSMGTGSQNNMYIVTVDRSKYDVNFIGTTTQGIFNNVYLEHNWATGFSWPNNVDGVDFYMVRASGQVGHGKTPDSAASAAGYSSSYRPSTANIKNTSNIAPNGGNNVFTSLEKNELVYVFDTINAYKNYNAGSPQPYYLTSSGQNTGTWTASSGGVINTGTMNNSGNYYSQVTNGVGSNWTPEQILELVDKVSNSTGKGSGSDDDDDNPFSFLGDIGDLIKDLVTGVGDLLTDLVGSLVDVVLGTKQEDGTRSGGIIGLITDILSSLTGLINTNIGDFLSAVFGWLPTEFVTIFKAMLIFGIFFSIWKLIRG